MNASWTICALGYSDFIFLICLSIASYNIPDEYARVIIQERIESLTKDQIEEIMNSIDENIYPSMMPYINKLSFEERMDIMDDFDLDISENKKDKNESGKLFSGLAMTSAQAKRLVEWLMKNGYSKQEADKALMYVMTGIESE